MSTNTGSMERKAPIELTRRGSDEVLCYACGDCGTVCRTRSDAERCCHEICTGCGAPTGRRSLIRCNACQAMDRAQRQAAGLVRAIERAKRVALADYNHRFVIPEGRETGWTIKDAVEAGHTWAWACVDTPWPTLDAERFLDGVLEEHYEGAIDDLDVTGLQRALDAWLAAQPPCRGYTEDRSRIVVLDPRADPLTERGPGDLESRNSASVGTAIESNRGATNGVLDGQPDGDGQTADKGD